jgi:hypothetical protein
MPAGYLIDPGTGLPTVQTSGGFAFPLPLSEEELRAAGVAPVGQSEGSAAAPARRGGYVLDPETGMPSVQTASGAFMPLPFSPEELQAAGVAAPKPAGPDLRLADNSADLSRYISRPDAPAPLGSNILSGGAPPPMKIADFGKTVQFGIRPQVSDAPQWVLAGTPEAEQRAAANQPTMRLPTTEEVRSDARRAQPTGASVDPSSLATGGGAGGGAPAPAGAGAPGGIDDPLVQQAMAEAMRGGGGGGGPRGLGVSGETRKLKTFEHAADPQIAAEAQQAQLASEGYNEQLAMSLQRRQQQAYEAQQGEFASRAGQLQAAQERYERQQAMIQDYASKRDALMEEARQMKAPDQRTYWQEAGMMGRLTAGLSMVFGGALSGLRGGPNQGYEATRAAVDDWMRVRHEEYNRATSAADKADTQLGKLVQQFGSENLALENMRLQAWEVRDAMLKSYAEKIGTPDALETYNQAMLQSEAEKAEARAKASQGAEVEIEQKLSMQGGGGGGQPGVLKMLRAGAEAKKLKDVIAGADAQQPFQREVQNEKVEGITGALEAIEAADEVQHTLRQLNVQDDDFDNPLAGPGDFITKALPQTEGRRHRQALEQQTSLFARGLQKSLGKSDNDARLADQMAEGGGSGRERFMAAETGRRRAQGSLQNIVASLTPVQQQTLLRSLEANSPARAAQVRAAIAATATPQAAASEQRVTVP